MKAYSNLKVFLCSFVANMSTKDKDLQDSVAPAPVEIQDDDEIRKVQVQDEDEAGKVTSYKSLNC